MSPTTWDSPRRLRLLVATDDADAHFAAAVALCERARARPYLAWTHHDWARALLAQGRNGEAREHAEAAVAIAEEVGMSGPDGPLPSPARS